MDCDYCKNEIAPSKVRKSTGGNFDIVKNTIAMPFNCRRCGGSFCRKHRLPENHACGGLKPKIKIDLTDIEFENIIESEHDEKTESHSQPKIIHNQESEYINCNICGKKEKIHKRSVSRTVGVNVNFKHSDPENIQYTCLFCGNEYCYNHAKPDYHYCSYSIWNPYDTRDKKWFLNSTTLKRILLVLAILFAYFLFVNYPINLESIDNITSKFEILDVNSFFENDKTNNYVETYEHIYVEEDGNKIYVGGDGYEIYLQNNPDAIDPIYSELVNFIKKDKTDQIQYSDDFVCADYAELVHNNAEANGIKTAWVAISFYDNDDGHALNAFNTLDKGLVYIDSTGGTEIGPCSYDRLIGIEIGKPMWYYELYKCNDDYYYPPFISSKVKSIEIIW